MRSSLYRHYWWFSLLLMLAGGMVLGYTVFRIELRQLEALAQERNENLAQVVRSVHETDIDALVRNEAGLAQKDKAFTLTAELLLMQHSCQWFCRSKATASARMMARHQTPHEQLVASVSAETRNAYLALIKGG
jgi:hypothetical protein